MTRQRKYTPIDTLIMGFSNVLLNTTNTLNGNKVSSRKYPGETEESAEMSHQERQLSGRYMRVNHVGEICAQALYQSQALTARDQSTKAQMQQAAQDEIDHLAWCEQRITELNSRKSLLNPLWYTGSFLIGAAAGVAGDKWNLGFVAETERQVVNHLEEHLGKLPQTDTRSREIVGQMKQDEAQHAEQATLAGAADLPAPAKFLMKCASKVMTRTAYWL